MHPDDPLRGGDGRRDLGDGQRRRVRREDRVASDDALELAKEIELRAELLDDRLDDEVTVREVVERRRERERRERVVPLLRRHLGLVDLPAEEVRDPLVRPAAELVGHLAPDRLVARLDRELGDTGPHGAETDDADATDLGDAHRGRS